MEHPMTFGDFQAEAARTGGTDLRPDRQMQGLVCAALGLAGEAAEVLSGALFPNTMTGSDFAQEIGDVLWCAAHLCNVLGWRFSGVTAPDMANVAPVSRRWDIIRDFHEDHCLASRGVQSEANSGARVLYATRVMLCAGGIADAVKKATCHGQPLERHLPAINRDLNSLMASLVLTCEAAGVRLDGAARLNVEKMRKRYPDGFTTEASVVRRDEPSPPAAPDPSCSEPIGKVRILDQRHRFSRPEIACVVGANAITVTVQSGEVFTRNFGRSVHDPLRSIDPDDLAVIRMTLAEKGL